MSLSSVTTTEGTLDLPAFPTPPPLPDANYCSSPSRMLRNRTKASSLRPPTSSPSAGSIEVYPNEPSLSFTKKKKEKSNTRHSSGPDLNGRHQRRPLRSEREIFQEAKTSYEIGVSILRLDDPRSAISYFSRASQIFSRLGKGQLERRNKSLWQVATCWGRLGWTAKKMKEWTVAKEAFEKALQIFDTIGDREKEATTLYQLSSVSFDIVTVSACLKQAALLYSELNHIEKEAVCLAELGSLFGKNSVDVSTSLFYWRQALSIYRRTGDVNKEAKTLYTLGELLIRSNDEDAYFYLAQARESFLHLGTLSRWAGDCSYQLGKICVAHKRFQDAVQFLEEASTLFRNAGHPSDEAWSLYRLGLVMLKVRSHDLAIDYLLDARRLFREVGNERDAEGRCGLRLANIIENPNPPLDVETLLHESLGSGEPRDKRRIEPRSTSLLEGLSSCPPSPSEKETHLRFRGQTEKRHTGLVHSSLAADPEEGIVERQVYELGPAKPSDRRDSIPSRRDRDNSARQVELFGNLLLQNRVLSEVTREGAWWAR